MFGIHIVVEDRRNPILCEGKLHEVQQMAVDLPKQQRDDEDKH